MSEPVSGVHQCWENVTRVVVILQSEYVLFDMVRTLHAPCGFTGCLYRRQKKGDEHPNNRNNDKKFHEREGDTLSS